MSEIPQSGRPDVNENYRTSSINVRMRFETNNLAEPYVDLDDLSIRELKLTGNETLVDGGTSDGSHLQRVIIEHGHAGIILGFDPNIGQFDNQLSRTTDPAIARLAIKEVLGPDISGEYQEGLVEGLSEAPTTKINLIEGKMSDIPLPEDYIDVLFALGVLYHEQDLDGAFAEIRRTLKPDGRLVVMTSGLEHKLMHRMFEREIATFLGKGTVAPAAMNAGFTSEGALERLPQEFKHVYLYSHDAEMVVTNPRVDSYSLRVYLNSIRTMRDQFNPVPSPCQLESALDEIVVPKIMAAIAAKGRFVDVHKRALFICSNEEQDLDPAFVRVDHNYLLDN